MDAEVVVESSASTKEGFAVVQLFGDGGAPVCKLDLEFSKFARLGHQWRRELDFVLLAAAVYAIDKVVSRRLAVDAWTRNISLTVPVSAPESWSSIAPDLEECLGFLSGDRWRLTFRQLDCDPIRPLARLRRRRYRPRPKCDVVCLFSGGLDSLIGAIDILEERRYKKILLVGHHDGQMAGPLHDQQILLERLRSAYPFRVDSLFARVGHTEASCEITLRSRSLLFVAMGVFAASAMGPSVPLYMPENGTIALNVPLTPSRRGSCSTRTAHPYYLGVLDRALKGIGFANCIVNPLKMKTKGEALSLSRNLPLLRDLSELSVSCAKRGHKVHFTHREASGCGRCMPCVYRRAALHSVGLDTEQYGSDLCVGEVDLNDRSESGPNDLRACFSFLKRNPSPHEIERLLLCSGSLDLAELPAHANLVKRAMDEVRQLIRDKATPDIRRRAGIS